jgi:endonuclease YncB( thermonuclease family)
MVTSGVLVLGGCALPEDPDDRGLLRPLHGPVAPAAVAEPIRAPIAPPPEPAADGAEWRVADVLDGRTLEIYQGLDRATATLGGIVVPTGEECLADLATDSLRFITGGGRPVEVIPPTATDGRIDGATIIDENGDDLAAVMLSLGLARVGDDAGPDRAALYADIEQGARDAGDGIWSDECAG